MVYIMKYAVQKTKRGTALLLAMLLLGTTVLTACTAGNEPPASTENTQPQVTETAGENLTLGEPETADPAQTVAPENDYTPPESLIGDGSEIVGIFPTFSEKGGL